MSASDALAYVDKSIDNIVDLDADLTWTNLEVFEMLEDIRSMFLTGEVTPGTFRATDREVGGLRDGE